MMKMLKKMKQQFIPSLGRKITDDEKRLLNLRNKLSLYIGKEICLDLGQIGPSYLKVLKIVGDKVWLKYNSTGKEIDLNIETVCDQLF